MRTIYLIFILPAFALTISSCGKSFLDNAPKDVIPREAYTNNLNQCQELLSGLYMEYTKSLEALGHLYGDVLADNIKPQAGLPYFTSFYKWNMQASELPTSGLRPTDLNANNLIYNLYRVTRTSSYLIERATTLRDESPQRADQIIGEAITFRAMIHFQLLNILAQPYSYTPLGTHTGIVYVTTSDWTKPVTDGRSSVATVYRHLIDDLKKATTLLEPIKDSNVFIRRETAFAFLSRVCLYAQDYTGALENATKALDGHSLLTIGKGYPDAIFSNLKFSESESYLQLLPGPSEILGNVGIGTGFPNYYYQLGVFFATADLTSALQNDPADIRNKWLTANGANWKITKFPTGVVSDVYPVQNSYFLPVIRVSEVVLNAAEAAYHLQQTAKAQSLLNSIRLRAQPTADPTTATGSALLDAIRNERRIELAFEGNRFFDLRRWKMPVLRSDPSSPDAASLPYPDNRAVAPLPKLDISSTIPQNPGY